jgi:hypothetical protein
MIAGLVETRRNRRTASTIAVYDGDAAGLDTEAGRWQTVCETHSTILSHETQALALLHMATPDEWCEPCRKARAIRLTVRFTRTHSEADKAAATEAWAAVHAAR